MARAVVDLCTDKQIKNRLRVAAMRKSLKLWPLLVERESRLPEPNLLKPRPLVDVRQLEDFLYQAMLKRFTEVERAH